MNGQLERAFDALNGMDVRRGVPMSELTSFRIGGPAALVARPRTEAEFVSVCAVCTQQEIPYRVLGNGTNVLAPDAGFAGLILRMDALQHAPRFSGDTVTADAGLPVSKLVLGAVAAGYTGMDGLCGIPGTVGGACAMNAGSYGSEIKDTLYRVRLFQNGEISDVDVTDSDFGYRKSRFSAPQTVVLSASFRLTPDDGLARARIADYAKRRAEKQPLSYPSAGSVFKRPEGHFAGSLIEQCGLKGERIGGAQVSEKHAGFIVNTGGATERDVLELIGRVQKRVLEETGVMLEREIKLLCEV